MSYRASRPDSYLSLENLGSFPYNFHVKYTQKETSEVSPIEDAPYIKYRRSATIRWHPLLRFSKVGKGVRLQIPYINEF